MTLNLTPSHVNIFCFFLSLGTSKWSVSNFLSIIQKTDGGGVAQDCLPSNRSSLHSSSIKTSSCGKMLTKLNNLWYRSGKTSAGNLKISEAHCLPLKFSYRNKPKANQNYEVKELLETISTFKRSHNILQFGKAFIKNRYYILTFLWHCSVCIIVLFPVVPFSV